MFNKSFFRPLKSKITEQISIGSWITIPNTTNAEILGKLDFYWLTIDLEHSPISLESCSELIRTLDLLNIITFVRVGDHNPNVIKRLMDMGAHGIIASTVSSKCDAKNIVEAVKYPPEGSRGVGLSKAQGYGYDFENYCDWLRNESIVICQIENSLGLDNMEDIANVQGVDGIFVGPYDLSCSLGIPGDFSHPKMVSAMARVSNIKVNKPFAIGIHVVKPNPNDIVEKVKMGFNMIAYGIDYLFTIDSASSGIQKFKNIDKIYE